MIDYLWLLIGLPLAGAATLLLLGKKSDSFGHLLGTAASAASFGVGLVLFFELLGREAEDRSMTQTLFTWIDTGAFTVDMSLHFDQLSALFVLLITGVGTLIHIYSIGYMEHDERRRRFFAYLNLFIAAMLTLVLAADYLVLFLGWEGVGLASYLLIGFWLHKPSAAAAAKKAFVMNRVGDLGMAAAIMVMFFQFGTSNIAVVNASVSNASTAVATTLGLLLLLGAAGKSAQVPLQAWLLDAMEGPTPVSALIHAATMVTAGVYLIVRSNGIFDISETARTAVVIVGTVTLLAGALIGTAKDDIKKALAGSTMSQIGYMTLAAGLGPAGYVYAIFHLLTHGFFKANMFLGAGSVMHGMNDDVDMRHYGALRQAMPITFATFAFGYLAIIGFPGFSGFFSKDKIIEAAFGHSFLIGSLALLGAGITAFYMTRVMMMTFYSNTRWRDEVHPHESPKVMTVPLVILAAASLAAGLLILGGWISSWLEPVVGYGEHHELAVSPAVMSVIVTLVVAVGVAIGIRQYRSDVADTAPEDVNFLTRLARNDLYGDAINDTIAVKPMKALTRSLVNVDRYGIDKFVSSIALFVTLSSQQGRRLQTGYARSYALMVLIGAVSVLAILLAVTLR